MDDLDRVSWLIVLGAAGAVAFHIVPRLAADVRHLRRQGHAPATVCVVLLGALFTAGMVAAIGTAVVDDDPQGRRTTFLLMTTVAFVIVEPLIVGFAGALLTPSRRTQMVDRGRTGGAFPWHVPFYAAAAVLAAVLPAGLVLLPDEASSFALMALIVIAMLAVKGRRAQKQLQGVRAADSLLVQDTRAPVLYLREFAREGEPFMKPTASEFFVGAVGTIRSDLSGYETVEDYLSAEIERSLGPFVALGSPEDHLQPLGAARTYADDQEWKRSFEALVQRSRAILLHPGSSRALFWEIGFVRQSGHAGKLFVVVGSLSFTGSWVSNLQWRMKGRQRQPKWPAFRADMHRAGYQLPDTLGSNTALIAFDAQGQGTVYHCDGEADSYVLAIQGRLDPPALLSTEKAQAAAARASRFL